VGEVKLKRGKQMKKAELVNMERQMEVYWTMKNGEKINVDEMTIEHLRNVLKMILTNDENEWDGFDPLYDTNK
jgi:hypothetical protein